MATLKHGESSAGLSKTPSTASVGTKAHVAHRGAKIGVCVFLCVLSVAAIVVGALLPTIVDGVIEKQVLEKVRFDPVKWEAKDLDR